jgi:pyruvate dehydrogenase E2 component (dihydrolipoamide acetyltransferase)
MPFVILMPALSPTMTEGHLVKWHKSIGDHVRPGDVLMDIETDKAIMEVEATQEGVLVHIWKEAPAESVQVGNPLAILKQAGEANELWERLLEEAMTSTPGMDVQSADAPTAVAPPVATAPKEALEAQPLRMRISPLARKIAQLSGLDLVHVQGKGTGPRGRILKHDVEAALDRLATTASNQASTPVASYPLEAYTLMPLTPMRKVIAERLSFSKQTIPHFILSAECCMDELLILRQKIHESLGEKLFSINDFLVKACAMALHRVPEMNTLWGESSLKRYTHVDLAVAVSVPGGLITPLVFAAETKSLRHISSELKQLIQRARAGKLRTEEYQWGTFTLSNLGAGSVTHFQAIINPPHSGILAIGASQEKPIVDHGSIRIAQSFTATLSADHRVIDGQEAAHFLTTFKNLVEHPYQLVV